LLKESDEARKNLGKQVKGFVKDSMKKFDIPSRNDLKKLEDRIKKLEKKI
jgi:polyhydroxyalkanoate synthesis regulator phasin